MEDKAKEILNCAIDRVNEVLSTDGELSKDKGTVLLGQGGKLDSMGFINLLVAIEEELDTKSGIKTSLTDEIMRMEGILTVGDLYELVDRLIRTGKSGVDLE